MIQPAAALPVHGLPARGRGVRPLPLIAVLSMSLALSGCVTGGRPPAQAVPLPAAQPLPGPTPILTPPPAYQAAPGGFAPGQGQAWPGATGQPAAQMPVQTGSVKVALLLPLSGNDAELGQAMVDAANMAVFDVGRPAIELQPRDTGGVPEKAAAAARAALGEGARLILGPLFAGEVGQVRGVLQQSPVAAIAFTTSEDQVGGKIYTLGYLASQQVSRVLSFAAQRGKTRVALLVPDGAYGSFVQQAAQRVASSGAISLVKVARYGTNTTDYRALARSFLDVTARGGAVDPSSGAITQPPSAALPFDAVLLPEGGDRLARIAQALEAAGLRPGEVQMLGTGQWDNPQTGQIALVRGGWFAGPDPSARNSFEQRFQSTYGRPPPRLAAMAYDAAALAAALASPEAPGAGFEPAALINRSGFVGIDGPFRLQPSGQVERALAVLEVGFSGAGIIDPAPTGFMAAPGN